MKYITLSNSIPVTLTNEKGDAEEIKLEPLNFYHYLNDSDQLLNSDGKGIKASVRIDAAIRKARSEKLKVLALEDEDRDLLLKAALKPSNGYPFKPARVIAPFVTDLEEATDTAPEEDTSSSKKRK